MKDVDILKDFYKQAHKMTKRYAPQATFIFHDAGFYDYKIWNNLLLNYTKVAMDHHYYQVRSIEGNGTSGYTNGYINEVANAKNFKMSVWFGEWALSTDVCAQWLEGLNDGYTDISYHGQYCLTSKCPISYLPDPFNVDFDRAKQYPGPYGTDWANTANIYYGTCVSDSYAFGDSSIKNLAATALSQFRAHLGGSFYMNSHTEMHIPRFDYMMAWNKGWLN